MCPQGALGYENKEYKYISHYRKENGDVFRTIVVNPEMLWFIKCGIFRFLRHAEYNLYPSPFSLNW